MEGDEQWAAAGTLDLEPSGNLYGTTLSGGGRRSGDFCYQGIHGVATVFELMPSGSGWTEKTLHSFQGGSDVSVNPIGGLTRVLATSLSCKGGINGGWHVLLSS